MFPATLQVRISLGDALYVLRKASASEHHAVAGADFALTTFAAHQHADHLAVLGQHPLGRCRGQDRNAQVQRRFGQTRCQRIAAGHVDGALVERQFLEVIDQPFGHVQKGRE